MTIRIYAQKHLAHDGLIIPFLASVTDEDTSNIAPVSLARNRDHCFYNVGSFHHHNQHSPPMKSEADADSYFAHIKEVVAKVVSDAGDPVLPKLKIEMPIPPLGWFLLYERVTETAKVD